MAALAVGCLATWSAAGPQNSSRDASSNVSVDQTSIGGTVVNSDGAKPEAGVWVIAAETKSLPVPFRKTVVTDNQGRFLVPDLPGAKFASTEKETGSTEYFPRKIASHEM